MSTPSTNATAAPKNTKVGFTLIELLVVITIISVLASILFPVFARAREKARQTACLSNLKQIGAAVLQYVHDYDETWPVTRPVVNGANADGAILWESSETLTTPSPVTRSMFANAMEPYIKSWQVWGCPSGEDFNFYSEPESDLGQARFSYAMNAYLNVYPDGQIVRPAETASFVEMARTLRQRKYMQVFPIAEQEYTPGSGLCPSAPYQFCVQGNGFWSFRYWTEHTYFVHGNRTNMVYADGHAKAIPNPSAGSLWRGHDGRGIPVASEFRGITTSYNLAGRSYEQKLWIRSLAPAGW